MRVCVLLISFFGAFLGSTERFGLRYHERARKIPGAYDVYLDSLISKYENASYYLKIFGLVTSNQAKRLIEELDSLRKEIQDRVDYVSENHKRMSMIPFGVLANRYIVDDAVVAGFRSIDYYRRILSFCLADLESRILTVSETFLDPVCMSAYNKSFNEDIDCRLSSLCFGVIKKNVDGLFICSGYSKNLFRHYRLAKSTLLADVFPLREGQFEFYCNVSNNRPLLVHKSLLNGDKRFVDPFSVLLQSDFPFLTFSDGGYRALVFSQFVDSYSTVSLATAGFKYVCNDTLFAESSIIDDVNVFRSFRGCRNFVLTEGSDVSSKICVDHLYQDFQALVDRCPEDWYTFDHAVATFETYTIGINDYSEVLWKTIPQVVTDLLRYFDRNHINVRVQDFEKFYKDFVDYVRSFGTLTNVTVRFADQVFDGIGANLRLLDSFTFRNFSENFVDYFWAKAMGVDVEQIRDTTHFESIHSVTSVSGWLAQAISSFVRPFWQVFLELLEDILDIIIRVLFDLTPLLEKFYRLTLAAFDSLLNLLFQVLTLVLSFLLHILIILESKILLSEYLLVYLFLSRYWSSPVPPLLILLLLILVFGFQRSYPSFLFFVLNHQIKSVLNATAIPSVTYDYQFVYNITLVNYTHHLYHFSIVNTPYSYSFYVSNVSVFTYVSEKFSSFNSTFFVTTFSHYLDSSDDCDFVCFLKFFGF
ncbi:hypothetical protein [Xingshan nematode virus 2]|uniref:hypothetical protein n=1 Tax=Xingshan nematode virus 2 TaxID=1923761 RepID=UPI00090A0231|nr:hypothetical protein [Xingshan nematode virus 2]APG77849.1 hypothetical protein [Xingshan nematode virus 2]